MKAAAYKFLYIGKDLLGQHCPYTIALWIQYVYMYFHFSGDLEIYTLDQRKYWGTLFPHI